MKTKIINDKIKNNMPYPKLMVRRSDECYVWFSSPKVGCCLHKRICDIKGKEYNDWDMSDFVDCEPGTKIEFNLEN